MNRAQRRRRAARRRDHERARKQKQTVLAVERAILEALRKREATVPESVVHAALKESLKKFLGVYPDPDQLAAAVAKAIADTLRVDESNVHIKPDPNDPTSMLVDIVMPEPTIYHEIKVTF